VVTARASHEAGFAAHLAGDARLRTREVLVLGRSGERPGDLVSTVRVRRDGVAALHQAQRIGVPELDASPAHLAGRRVLGTEILFWGEDPGVAVSHDWWSLVPLARGGSLASALADDAVTAGRWLDEAVVAHPGWAARIG
jgi:urease accessory protein